ncbi:1376_t:CDS:2 [Paraglomus occultum]|uniref:1376_t:CDS:1 n=1 Tax=Paraglomus occultum TaxID=144539 RepID=A0A9N8WRB9_9GLOM|nr:1376_t:CDS:2 [Paraglomus occultum]
MWKNWFDKHYTELTPASSQFDEEALADYVNTKVIYQAGVDFESKPMVVICACNLPNPKDVDYDKILGRILQRLDLFVESDYSVVFFAGGAKYRPGWSWILKAYSSLGRKYKKNLKSFYVVHASRWTRLILDLMSAVISPKFLRKVKYVSTLSELARYVPLTQIDIPPVVYEYNIRYEDKIALPSSQSYDEHGHLMFGVPIEVLMGSAGEKGIPRVVKECVAYLRANGLYTEGVFRRSPNSMLLRQAREAYDRGNPIKLEDYGVHTAAVLLKMFFHQLPKPIIPSDLYDVLRQISQKPTPLDRVEFIRNKVFSLLSPAAIILLRHVFSLLRDIAEHREENKMTSYNLAVMLAPNLVHSGSPTLDVSMCTISPDDERVGGGVGLFVRICIEHFDLVFEDVDEPKELIRDVIETASFSTSSSMSGSTESSATITLNHSATLPYSSPPKYPSLRRMKSFGALSSNNVDVRVGSGVEVAGVMAQGLVSRSPPPYAYRDDPNSPLLEGLRVGAPW